MFIKLIFFHQKGDDDDGDMDSYQVLLLLLLNHTAWGTANANCYQSISRILAQTVLAFEVLSGFKGLFNYLD